MDGAAQRVGAGVDGRYAWARLFISMLFGTIGGAGMWAVVVVMPAVEAEFGVDRADASIPYTATMVGFALGNVFVGRAVDRFGFWRPALVSSLALGGGFLLASVAPTIGLFALIQGVLIGTGTAIIFAPLIADLSHWFWRRRGLAVSLAASGNYLAGAFWPAVMPPALDAFGWRMTYAGIGLFCIAAMVPLLLLLKRPAPVGATDAAQAASPARPLAIPLPLLQWLLVLAGLSCCIAMAMPQVHIVAYCLDLGFGVARGAEMLSLMLAAGVVSRVASGFIADRIGGVRTLLIGSVAQAVSLLLYIPFDGLAPLYVVSLIFGLSQGGIVPCYAIIVRETMPAAEAGQRVGIVMMATVFGMAIGGWMSGWIYDLTGSYAMAFLHGIGWNMLNIAIAVLFLWRARPTLSPRPA